MAGLMIKMPAGDRIVLNGAVVENAGRGARLRILTPDTQLLRLRDAIDPGQATTPVSRVAHAIQLMLVGEVTPSAGLTETMEALLALRHAFVDSSDRDGIDAIMGLLEEGRFYQALRRIGPLRDKEAVLLSACSS
ncbi:MAG: flagellar biosynthesis repressor FlbT [Pseudomonadota bacterium]